MAIRVKVGMADLKVCNSPDTLITLGLGSCVGVCLFDNINKVAGLAHIMLPNSKNAINEFNPAKYADTAIVILLDEMKALGANIRNITAKLAGGAQMFSFKSDSAILRIGEQNAKSCLNMLNIVKIPVIASDLGGKQGRTIELYSATGILHIKTLASGEKNI